MSIDEALKRCRDDELFEAVQVRFEAIEGSSGSMGLDTLQALALEFELPELAIALILVEIEWDERGGPWVDGLEDQFDSLETTVSFFQARYGQPFEIWKEYIEGVLDDRSSG